MFEYKIQGRHQARGLEKEKLKQRLELCERLKRRGTILELFAGKGFLSRVYEKYADKLILVDNNKEYLDENIKQLSIRYEVFCMDNIKFCEERLPFIDDDIILVDFDSFGSTHKVIKCFFKHYKVKKRLLVAITDGSGYDLSWVRYSVKKGLRPYVEKTEDILRTPKKYDRTIIQHYLIVLLDKLGLLYNFNARLINSVVKEERFPIYLGLEIMPFAKKIKRKTSKE